MKKIEIFKENTFSDKSFKSLLIHDSEYFKILNFNLNEGQTIPIHSHDIEGQVSITVLEGQGSFLSKNDISLPANTGDTAIFDISEPHGVKADNKMRLLVVIAPPI